MNQPKPINQKYVIAFCTAIFIAQVGVGIYFSPKLQTQPEIKAKK